MHPSAQYSRIRLDPETANKFSPPMKPRTFKRLSAISVGLLLLFIASLSDIRLPFTTRRPLFPKNTLIFDREPRPSWLDKPSQAEKPLVLRVAVVSRVEEFDRRQALREGVFNGIPESVARVEHRFFVGATPDTWNGRRAKARVEKEVEEFGDVVVMDDVADIIERLSEKRYRALQWAGSLSHDSYDYFLNLDSDTFCRLPALARSLPQLLAEKDANLNPREHPILIGRMSDHLMYFLNTVPEGSANITIADDVIKGPWYPYPSGIGYLISSSLVKDLLSTNPPLPHHVRYPSDDVMVGSWIASLRYMYESQEHVFETIVDDHGNETSKRVYPKPFLSRKVETTIIDDVDGWHDLPHQAQTFWRDKLEAPVSWGSVCIHKFSSEQIRGFRKLEELRGEWDPDAGRQRRERWRPERRY